MFNNDVNFEVPRLPGDAAGTSRSGEFTDAVSRRGDQTP